MFSCGLCTCSMIWYNCSVRCACRGCSRPRSVGLVMPASPLLLCRRTSVEPILVFSLVQSLPSLVQLCNIVLQFYEETCCHKVLLAWISLVLCFGFERPLTAFVMTIPHRTPGLATCIFAVIWSSCSCFLAYWFANRLGSMWHLWKLLQVLFTYLRNGLLFIKMHSMPASATWAYLFCWLSAYGSFMCGGTTWHSLCGRCVVNKCCTRLPSFHFLHSTCTTAHGAGSAMALEVVLCAAGNALEALHNLCQRQTSCNAVYLHCTLWKIFCNCLCHLFGHSILPSFGGESTSL